MSFSSKESDFIISLFGNPFKVSTIFLGRKWKRKGKRKNKNKKKNDNKFEGFTEIKLDSILTFNWNEKKKIKIFTENKDFYRKWKGNNKNIYKKQNECK